MELTWVLYAVLSQMAVGMALVLALVGNLSGWAATGTVAEGLSPARAGWMIVTVLMLVGLGSAGYGQGALAENWSVLMEQGWRWLSPPVQVYTFFVLLGLWQVRREQPRLAAVTALVGLLGLVLAARDYRSASPVEPSSLMVFVLYALTALSLGIAYTLRLTGEAARRPLRLGLALVLVAGLCMYTVVPVLAGSEWLAGLSVVLSPRPVLVWIGLVCAYVAPLAALWKWKTLPDRVPWVMLFGEMTLRMLFV